MWNRFTQGLDSLMGAPQLPQGGVMGEPQINPQRDARLALATNLLAGSNSGKGFNEIFAKALMAGQAARQQAQLFGQQAKEQQSQEQYRQAQIESLNRPPEEPADVRTARALMGDPELRRQFEEMQRLGLNVNDPSDVRTFKFRQSLSPEQRAEFDRTRWAPPAVSVQDVAGGRAIVDPGQRLGGSVVNPITTAEQETAAAAERARQTAEASAAGGVTGKYGAEAIENLGTVEQKAQQAIDVLGQLKSHKGLPFITGAYSLAPIVPGTDQAAADALAKQVEGQAFLQAFETLKGGGQITQVEGEKATQAMARLARAQKTEDYKKAVDELLQIASRGLERARQKAKSAEARQPGASATSVRKYNPATGRIE